MRGQISLFIIIGILVVMAFGFSLYAASSLKRTSSPESVSIEGISDMVSVCLSKAGEEGLSELARNGFGSGVVIDAPLGGLGLRSSNVPEYPFPGFPFVNNTSLFAGYYGVSLLPPLYGPHPNSVEEKLAGFIEQHVVSCVDWSGFNQIAVESGSPQVQLVMARSPEDFENEDSLTLLLDWPMNITSDNRVVPRERFTARLPVRLAKMYYAANELIDAEVSDISYVPQASLGFTVTRERIGNASVIRLTDVQSEVNNLPFEVMLARNNRHPALWEINASNFVGKMFHVSPEGKGALISIEGNSLTITDPCPDGTNPLAVPLNASDPDEDAIQFTVDVPGSQDNRLPQSAIGDPYQITVFASDGSLADFQKIPLQVTLCRE